MTCGSAGIAGHPASTGYVAARWIRSRDDLVLVHRRPATAAGGTPRSSSDSRRPATARCRSPRTAISTPDATPPDRAITLDRRPPDQVRDAGHRDPGQRPRRRTGRAQLRRIADHRGRRRRTRARPRAGLPSTRWSPTTATRAGRWSTTRNGPGTSRRGRTGTTVDPLPFFSERARPHPLGTLLQRSTLTGAWRSVPVKHYVVALRWPGETPLARAIAKVKATSFVVHERAPGTTCGRRPRPGLDAR